MANNFLTPLEYRQLPGRTREILTAFEFHLGSPDGQEFVRVPAGFLTDFASIPRLLWPAWPPDGDYAKAAVVHDKLYRNPCLRSNTSAHLIRRVTRAEADGIFNEAMGVLGVGWWTRRLLYAGVRSGGWRAWNRHRP